MMSSERGLARLTWFLLFLGAARLFLLVLHEPMYGYANNYDFIRVSSWFHLWADPADAPPDFDPLKQHPSGPISTYRIDPTIDGERYYVTSDLIFVWTALQVGKIVNLVTGAPADQFDLRTLGVIRALALLACGVFVTRRFFARSAQAGVVSALVFALVLADPAFTLLFNTLYSGYATVLFSYLAAALVIEALAFGPWASIGSWLLLSSSFVLLALSKVQFIGLPIAFATMLVSATLLLHRTALRQATIGLGLALMIGAAAAGAYVQTRTLEGGGYSWSMRMGAATDTYFGAALPHFSDSAEGLRLLGLPARCAPYIGKNWYDAGMQPPPCPEVGSVPRWRLLRLFLHEPSMIVGVGAEVIPLLQPLIVRYYGQVEGEPYAQADLRIGNGLVSVGEWPEGVPPSLFGLLLSMTLLGAVVALADVLRSAWLPPSSRASRARLLPCFVLVLGVIEVYCFATSWAGAGLIDLGRHSIVGQLAFLCLVVAAPWEIVRTARSLRGSPVS